MQITVPKRYYAVRKLFSLSLRPCQQPNLLFRSLLYRMIVPGNLSRLLSSPSSSSCVIVAQWGGPPEADAEPDWGLLVLFPLGFLLLFRWFWCCLRFRLLDWGLNFSGPWDGVLVHCFKVFRFELSFNY